MSLLVDLLSKTKTKESRKDVPPDLRRTVVDGTFKKKTRRKVVLLSILVLIVFIAGFATIYIMETFRSSLVTTIATKTDGRQSTASPATRDERSLNPSKTETPMNVASIAPSRVNLPQALPQERIQPAGESTSKKMSDGSRDDRPAVKPPVKTPAESTRRSTANEASSSERTLQKTNKDVYLYAARTHEIKGEYNLALEYYLKALDADPANHIVMNNIAGVFLRLKSYIEALLYAKKALDVKADYVPSLINAGIADVSMGNLSDGEGFLVKAVTVEPSNKVALFNLAVLYEKQGNFDKAYEDYYRLSQMRDIEGCLGAARILERQGQNSGAARFYREVLSNESASPSSKQLAIQRLSQITK